MKKLAFVLLLDNYKKIEESGWVFPPLSLMLNTMQGLDMLSQIVMPT